MVSGVWQRSSVEVGQGERMSDDLHKVFAEVFGSDEIADGIVTAANHNGRARGQRGRARATLVLLDACRAIIEEAAPITVRGVCYRLFVAGLISSMATKNTQKISRLLTQAREEGLIPWESIVDESRQIERLPHWMDLQQYSKVVKQSYRRDFWEHQDKRVIVISEKSTVAGILRPVLEEYRRPVLCRAWFQQRNQGVRTGSGDPTGQPASLPAVRGRLGPLGLVYEQR